jgi:serine/threonine protein kinase
VIYELLTGKHPFEADSFSRLIYKVVNEEVAHPSVLREGLPDNLGDYILHALQKDPARRYKSATEIIVYFSQVFPENDLSKTISEKQKTHRVNDIKALAIFEGFDEEEINLIVDNCIWQKYKEGDQIIKEYDQDDSFYIVDQGVVAVMKDDEVVSNLGKGECFGEMVYLSKQPRTATVTATSEVTVMKISGALTGRFSNLSQLRLCRTFLNNIIKGLEN